MTTEPDGTRLKAGVFTKATTLERAERKGRRRLRVILDRDGDQATSIDNTVSVEMMPPPGRHFARW